MLVRQKIITATAMTCIAIVLIATLAYIIAADRVGKEQLAPQMSRLFANLISQQLQTDSASIEDLKAFTSQLVNHYQIQEIALYNPQQERIIYSCNNACDRNLPIKFTDQFEADTTTFSYDIIGKADQQALKLIIEIDIDLPGFFLVDTIITALFIASVSSLLVFLLSNATRHWQKQPFTRLLHTIESIRANPSARVRFETNDADTARLSDALNQMIERNEEREESFFQAKEKAESARIRAIRLSNETRHINEKLAQEITIRRSVENQLQHTQNFLDSIIDSMPSGLFAVDAGGHIIQCNKQAADWLNTNPEPLTGQLLARFFPDIQQFPVLLQQCHQSHEVRKIERCYLQFPAQSFPADIVIYPLKHQGLDGLVVRIDDIDQRQKMEEIIVQTEKMKSVGGLAAGMAHEINNPLGAILQGVQNIQRRVQADNQVNQQIAEQHQLDLSNMQDYLEQRQVLQFLNNIQDAGKRAASIVSNMLQFSRGSQQSLSSIGVADLLERTVSIAQSDLDLKQIQLNIHCQPQDLILNCIPSEIEQVILNILQNAAHAMLTADEVQAPAIDIQAGIEQDQIVISISDNGPGMDETTSRRIFEPFYTTKDIGDGTGLGLSVSYFIITAHHQGQLNVITRPGEGAKFIIRLPEKPIEKSSQLEYYSS